MKIQCTLEEFFEVAVRVFDGKGCTGCAFEKACEAFDCVGACVKFLANSVEIVKEV